MSNRDRAADLRHIKTALKALGERYGYVKVIEVAKDLQDESGVPYGFCGAVLEQRGVRFICTGEVGHDNEHYGRTGFHGAYWETMGATGLCSSRMPEGPECPEPDCQATEGHLGLHENAWRKPRRWKSEGEE